MRFLIILCLLILTGCGSYQQGYEDGYGGYESKSFVTDSYKRGYEDGKQDFYEDTKRQLKH